jgi:formylglycine-generating enzyme required for sulfatase activity
MTDSLNSRIEKDGMHMIYVPAGGFLMGSLDSDSQAHKDEKPQHRVVLDAYWIDQTAVTNAMFALFVHETGYQTEAEQAGEADAWHHPLGMGSGLNGKMDDPAVYISWNDAQAYCQWVGRRLPTEAEWEKAARGTDGRLYPWGNQAPEIDPYCLDPESEQTIPVGLYRALGSSPYGCLDLTGNVCQWVADWYDEAYYLTSPARNPKGPERGSYRVLRGGSWLNCKDVRAATRNRFAPDFRIFTSFRCAR